MMIGARIGAWARRGAPLPYLRRVACLRSTGTQFIDTGIKLSGEYEVHLRVFIETNDRLGNLIYFGTNSTSIWITSGICRYSKNNMIRINNVVERGKYNEITLNERTGIVNSNEMQMSIGSFGAASNNPAYLFRAQGRSTDISDNLRISDWSATKNGVVEQKFISVIDLSGRPCFYNEAPLAVPAGDPSRYFYNQGTGDDFDWDEL